MGEVYRATDTRLGRAVAIKVLPDAVAREPERLARFEREARVLAALNHPNIAAIYGIEEADGMLALVLELVDGETLSERLRRTSAGAPNKGLPIPDALEIARRLAEALDAAHGKGVVHRDLKPANIKVTPDGTVKVLDFGIAKVARANDDVDVRDVATLADTGEGLILGTAAYMSPEQARGQAVDKRTDIWAFGCVLYEMLTGQAAFGGETASDSIARVLGTDPVWEALPTATPPGVLRLLRRCLERDAKRRLRDLGDLELALEVAEPTPVERRYARRRWVPWAVLGTGAFAVIAAFVAMTRTDETPPPAAPVRFEVPVAVKLAASGAFSLSPDGRHIVYSGTGSDGILRLWIRSLDALETRPVTGTETEIADNTSMFWSPDSRFVAFYNDGTIKKVDRAGGVPQVVCNVPGVAVGGAWNRGGSIVVGNSTGGLVRCPANGGDASPLTRVADDDKATIHAFPYFLPDDRHLLYLQSSRINPAGNGLYLADSARRPMEQSLERLLETSWSAQYISAPSGLGRLLFARDNALWSVPFDANQLSVSGTPVQIASPIGLFRDAAFFRATSDVLVYRGANPEFQLTWRDRTGRSLGTVGEPGAYSALALSPDARRAIVVRENPLTRADQDLWLLDLDRATSVRFSADPFLESVPGWSADGELLFFAVGNDGADLWAKPVNGGPGQRLLEQARNPDFRVNPVLTTVSATSDGRSVVFVAETRGSTKNDLWILPLQAKSRPAPLLKQEFDQRHGTISPDGRWLAYTSNESGVDEVFVRPLAADPATGLPKIGAAMPVSQGGGMAPRWRGNGQELFYQSSRGRVMAAAISVNRVDKPIELFQAPGMLPHWGVAADGQRFLVAIPVAQAAPAPFTVVLNWQAPANR
jgi:Tol biopolymer transport system component/tRNA A-37 threonylcarbamoyl transferase component Bud32